MLPVECYSIEEQMRGIDEQRLAPPKMQDRAGGLQSPQPRPEYPVKGHLAQTMRHQPPGFLGGLFSGLVKSASGTSTPAMSPFASRSTTPASTPLPTPNKVPTQAEIEAALLREEKKRDADKCALPAWY